MPRPKLTDEQKAERKKQREELKATNKTSSSSATVMYQEGATISLGAGTFEFRRIDVSISKTCSPDEIDSTYEELKANVNEKVTAEILATRSGG